MIILTERGTYTSDNKDVLLTDGISFGVECCVGKDRSKDELREISREEYEAKMMAEIAIGE